MRISKKDERSLKRFFPYRTPSQAFVAWYRTFTEKGAALCKDVPRQDKTTEKDKNDR